MQFTASILNLSSTLVNWQVNSVQSGNSTYGTIDTNGLYTAPKTVPTNNVVTITAVAQAQTSLTATANLTILQAATINTISCVNPLTELPSQTVASGASLLCTPTVAGGGNIAVFWYVNHSPTCSPTLGVLGGNSTVGIITGTQQGNYVGPQIPPPGGSRRDYRCFSGGPTQLRLHTRDSNLWKCFPAGLLCVFHERKGDRRKFVFRPRGQLYGGR